MELCQCNRKPYDPVDKGRVHFLLCRNCGRVIPCDVCKRKGEYVPIFSFASLSVGNQYFCLRHAWVAVSDQYRSADLGDTAV